MHARAEYVEWDYIIYSTPNSPPVAEDDVVVVEVVVEDEQQ